jgi:hypothetical protein
MAKHQKGGSPFTDSWFEMPFWFLLFLIIVIGILVWQFGIFNKPLPIPAKPKAEVETPRLEFISADESKLQYSATGCSKCKVNLRHGHSIYKEFPMGKHTIDLKTSEIVEGYISLNGTPLTPVKSIQPFSHKSSESSNHHPYVSVDPSKKAYISPSLVNTH